MNLSTCSKWFGKTMLAAAAFVFGSAIAFAQTKTVSGTVLDNFGETVIGANVVIVGTQEGTMTDVNGNFTLNNVPQNGTLRISYIGYATQEISVAGKSNIRVTLQEEGEDLDEVVVIGYGVVKKKDLTGSVASIKAADIQNVAAPNAMQAMQAKVPGMDLTQSSGQAGSGVSITLRGNRSITANNNPLIIVDGVEYGSTLDIPAGDIESMDILKDASSTAIYGTKGANGVIIITTKRGKAGKTRVNLNAYVSLNSPTNAVKSMYGNTEVQRWLDRANYQADLASGNWGSSNVTIDDVFGATTIAGNDNYQVVDLIRNNDFTDWYDTFLRNSASQNYEVSVSGGNDKTNFSLSLAAMLDEGLLKNDAMNRYNGRLNIDHSINKAVKVGSSMAFTYKSHDARNSSVFDRARKMTSITQAYKEDGTINETPNVWYNAHVNPLMDEGDAFQKNTETVRFLGSGYLQIEPIKNLFVKTQLAVDRTDARIGTYNDYHSVNRYQSPTTTYIENDQQRATILNWQNTINYSNLLAEKHSVNFLLGHEMSQTVKEGTYVSGTAGQEHYYNSSFYDLTKITGDIDYGKDPSKHYYSKQSMLSFFARAMYTYDNKYLVQAALRADGSSTLADGHKWGAFPSVSAGWRIIDENFMEGVKDWMDNLKIRAAWGVSGNAAIDPYMTMATVSSTTPGAATALIPMSMENPELSWETTRSFDLGLDFGFLGNRINGTIDYYWTNTDDLLYMRSAPPSSVFQSIISNVGESKGQGIEIALNALAVKTDDFSWDINFSYTHSKDEVKALADGLEENISGTTGFIVGQPVKIWYDYETDGTWGIGEFEQYVEDYAAKGITFTKPVNDNYGTPGTLKIKDINGDGVIDENDKRIYQQTPKHILGLTNTFTYRNWALSFQMIARLGNYIQYDKNNALGLNDGDANWADVDYWTPDNQGAKFPSPGTNGTGYSNLYTTYMSSLLWEKGDFFKIKDITLSYNLEKKWLEKVKISNAKIYCSLKNYLTWSKLDDNFDPEAGGSINFPLAKQVVIGLNVSF